MINETPTQDLEQTHKQTNVALIPPDGAQEHFAGKGEEMIMQ